MSRRIVGIVFCSVLLSVACSKKPEAPKTQASPTPTQATQPTAPSTVTTLPPEAPLPDLKIRATKRNVKYFPEGTPTRSIQELDDMLDSYISDPQTPEDKQYNADLKRVVLHGTFDVAELCRLALDKHWAERTPDEQTYFVDLMKRLLEKKAIFSKEQGQKKAKKKTNELYKVTYEGDSFLNPEKTQSLTKSSIFVPTENLKIGLNYKLKKFDRGWMLYDVIVDGASLLDNYKFQFDKIIEKEGYPSLIRRMESKLKDIAAGGEAD